MSEVNIVAIIHPTPGKVDRLKELLSGMTSDVHSKEDYTLRYIATEQLGEETPDIVMIETYKDESSADKHTSTDHFKELFAKMDKEGLMKGAPYLAKTKNVAGFDLDRKLIQ